MTREPRVFQKLRVLIVDDEPPARLGIRTLLKAHSDVAIVGEARTGSEAVEQIETLSPDLVFLDVQMPDGNGLDVIRAIGVNRMPAVIFSTAYDSYAVKAFEANAVDYLLKPYDRQRFGAALDRARAELSHGSSRSAEVRLRALVERMEEQSDYLKRLTVRRGSRIRLIEVGDVDYLEAEGNYVRVHVGDRSHLIRDTLTSLENRLDPMRFLRVHRSLIVQTDRIAEVESLLSGEYILFLRGGKRLTSGRTYRGSIQAALGLRV